MCVMAEEANPVKAMGRGAVVQIRPRRPMMYRAKRSSDGGLRSTMFRGAVAFSTRYARIITWPSYAAAPKCLRLTRPSVTALFSPERAQLGNFSERPPFGSGG